MPARGAIPPNVYLAPRKARFGFRLLSGAVQVASGAIMGYALPFALTGFGVSGFAARVVSGLYGSLATYRAIREGGTGAYSLGFSIGALTYGIVGRNLSGLRGWGSNVVRGLQGAEQVGRAIYAAGDYIATMPQRFSAYTSFVANSPGFVSGGGQAYAFGSLTSFMPSPLRVM